MMATAWIEFRADDEGVFRPNVGRSMVDYDIRLVFDNLVYGLVE